MSDPIGILGKKIGMTQIFQDGKRVPVTVVLAGPCPVLQVKTQTLEERPEEPARAVVTLEDTKSKKDFELPAYRTRFDKKTGNVDAKTMRKGADNYYAVQLGFDVRAEKTTNRAQLVHAAKATGKREGYYFIREIRASSLPESKIGDVWTVDKLSGVNFVDVVGTTKGKGFAGVMKRHGFSGQRASHGCEKRHRAPGGLGRQYSISKGVPKNKKMAGHMGNERCTAQNVRVIEIDAEKNLLLLKGAVPGANGSYVIIRKAVKKP